MKQLQKEVSRIKNELVRRLCDLDDILSQIEDEVKETHEDDDATIAGIVNNSIYIMSDSMRTELDHWFVEHYKSCINDHHFTYDIRLGNKKDEILVSCPLCGRNIFLTENIAFEE